jgi:hypothetical protein
VSIPKPNEAAVLKACLDYLALRGLNVARTNNAGVRRRDRTGRDFVAFHGTRGLADMVATLPVRPAGSGVVLGAHLVVECKRPGGKLSPHQEQYLASVATAGGCALVVTDVGQLARGLDDWLREREG